MRVFGRRLDFDARSLLILGALFILIGLSVIAYHPVDPGVLHTRLPVPVRVAIWVGAGALAIVGAFIGGKASWLGFGALFLGPGHRTLSFGWAMLTDAFSPDRFRWEHFSGFCVFLLVTVLVLHLAKGDEDAKRPPIVVHAVIPKDVEASFEFTADSIEGAKTSLKIDGDEAKGDSK